MQIQKIVRDFASSSQHHQICFSEKENLKISKGAFFIADHFHLSIDFELSIFI